MRKDVIMTLIFFYFLFLSLLVLLYIPFTCPLSTSPPFPVLSLPCPLSCHPSLRHFTFPFHVPLPLIYLLLHLPCPCPFSSLFLPPLPFPPVPSHPHLRHLLPSPPLGSNKSMLALRDHIESVTDGDDDVIVPTGKS